jgi:flagellar P-ring protein FlgI
MTARRIFAALGFVFASFAFQASANEVRLKDLGRFQGWRDNPLIGYGLVTGLAGSGDSSRNEATRLALHNVLGRLGVSVSPDQIQSRNIAMVMVTATLPASANVGDRIDVTVSSVGDARSLAGGSLVMTQLVGPNQKIYALAQGPLVVGGYKFDADQSLRQKNYPTTGILSDGATVEQPVEADLERDSGFIVFILKNPDFTTAEHVAEGINVALGLGKAAVMSPDAVRIQIAGWTGSKNGLLARIENVTIAPDQLARVVVNERSGTVVAGGGVQISEVVIAQGDIKVSVQTENQASQPNVAGEYVRDARGLIISNTRLDVNENRDAILRFPGRSVADLVQGLSRARVSTRNMIAILQAMKTAGALHAEIIVQ